MLTFALHPVVDGKCGCGDPACDREGKHPAERWKELPERAPLAPTENAGVGIATGARSGVFVVDLDVKNGVDGIENFAALGPVPPTYTVATPTGGYHLYFKHPGFLVRNSAPKSNPIAPGVDIRGDGGYVVAPGSPHKNGGRYAVAVNVAPADAPAWLLAWPGLKHIAGEPSQPATDIEADIGQNVPRAWRTAQAKAWLAGQPPAVEGQGGDALTFTTLTRAVHEFCLTDGDMIAEAFAEWNARCSPAWGGKQWAHKVDSVLHHSTVEWKTLELRTKYKLERIGSSDFANLIAKAAEAPHVAAPEASPEHVRTSGGLVFRCSGWDAPLEPPKYVVEGLFVSGSVSLFVAHGNSLKSMTSLSLGAAVSSGRLWLNRFHVPEAGPAVVVDYERNSYEARRRMKLLKAAEGLGRFLHSTQPGLRADDEAFWLDLASLKPRLLVVDSLTASALGVDENDRSAATPLVLAQRFAGITGAAVLFIHHARKGSGGDAREAVRGSTAIFAAVDAVFHFEPLETAGAPEGTKRMRVECRKMNLGREPPPFAVELSDARGLVAYDEPKADQGGGAEGDARKILSALHANPHGANRETLVRALGGEKAAARERLRTVLEQLILSNRIVQNKIGKQVFLTVNHSVES